MKCFRCFSFALFALLGVFFGSFIINQNDTYAVDDLVYSLNFSDISTSRYFCGGDSGVNCSDYSYIYFQPSSCFYDLSVSGARIRFYISGIFQTFYQPWSFGSLMFSINSRTNYIRYYDTLDLYSCSDEVFLTVTLSDHLPGSGSTSSGSIELTENGTYDVSQYAEAVVNVPETDCPPGAGGNYHEDLVAINNSIMICAATCLVIYFFYCIYRMIIKNSGVK